MTTSIFISYARADSDSVKSIYNFLVASGMSPWMDIHNILPGENWERAINQAIKTSDIFLAVLTNNSVNRRGVIQKELKQGMDKLDEYLPDDIYLIPVRLDECQIPERLSSLQVLDWENGWGKNKLLDAIRVSRIGAGTSTVTISAPPIPENTRIDLRKFLTDITLPLDYSIGKTYTESSGYFDGMVYTDFIKANIHGRFKPDVSLQEAGWIDFFLCKNENDAEQCFAKLNKGPMIRQGDLRVEKKIDLHGIGDKCKLIYILGVNTIFPLSPVPVMPWASQYEKDQYAKAVDEANIHDIHERFSIVAKICNAVFHVEAGDFKKLYWKFKEVMPSEDKFTHKREEFINYIKIVENKLRPLVCAR